MLSCLDFFGCWLLEFGISPLLDLPNGGSLNGGRGIAPFLIDEHTTQEPGKESPFMGNRHHPAGRHMLAMPAAVAFCDPLSK